MPRRDQPSICPTVHSQKPVLEFFFFFESEIFSSSPIYSNPGFSVTTHRRRDFFDYSDSAIFQPFRTWKFFRSFGLCHFSALSDSAIFQPFRTLPFLRLFGLGNFSALSDPDSHLYRPPIQLFTATLQAHHPGSRLGVSFCPISTPKI